MPLIHHSPTGTPNPGLSRLDTSKNLTWKQTNHINNVNSEPDYIYSTCQRPECNKTKNFRAKTATMFPLTHRGEHVESKRRDALSQTARKSPTWQTVNESLVTGGYTKKHPIRNNPSFVLLPHTGKTSKSPRPGFPGILSLSSSALFPSLGFVIPPKPEERRMCVYCCRSRKEVFCLPFDPVRL